MTSYQRLYHDADRKLRETLARADSLNRTRLTFLEFLRDTQQERGYLLWLMQHCGVDSAVMDGVEHILVDAQASKSVPSLPPTLDRGASIS